MVFCRSLAPVAMVPEPGLSCLRIARYLRVSSPTAWQDWTSSERRGREGGEGAEKDDGREGGREGWMEEGREEGREGREERDREKREKERKVNDRERIITDLWYYKL